MLLVEEHEEEVEENIEGLRSSVERLDNIACRAQDYWFVDVCWFVCLFLLGDSEWINRVCVCVCV